MGSEQSQQPNSGTGGPASTGSVGNTRQVGSRLQRGNTISVSGQTTHFDDGSPSSFHPDSRPVSPPISVCSDSDLPYISYTDKPIGGKH